MVLPYAWEGRCKSQPLLDEAAILIGMAYVDLNSILAKMATTPEASDFTSVQLHIRTTIKGGPSKSKKFICNEHQDSPVGLHFGLQDYLMVIEDTGRMIRDDKRGVQYQPLLPQS